MESFRAHSSRLLPTLCAGTGVFLMVAILGVSDQPSVHSSSNYFPGQLTLARESWANTFRKSLYSAVLESMDEPPISGAGDSKTESFRFVWLRSFHDYVAIRATRVADVSTIHVRVLRGFRIDTVDDDGTLLRYGPGELIQVEDRRLRDEDWLALVRQLTASRFWDMSSTEESKGADGAEWLLEGTVSGQYHAVARWSPRDGSFREVCLDFLKLSEEDLGPVY